MARSHDVRIREIMVWDTQGRMVNAVVSGILPARRCVLLSDGLLDLLTDQEIEAVFCHELGHFRHHHGVRLNLGVFVAMSAAMTILWFGGNEAAAGTSDMQTIASFLVVLVCFLLVGRYAWLLEFQADLWAVFEGRCGRRRYFDGLRKLADGAEDRSSWLHPSVSQRRALLEMSHGAAWAWLRFRLRWTELFLLLLPWTIAVLTILCRIV
jgi:Zn-dependent protease with chaperone function